MSTFYLQSFVLKKRKAAVTKAVIWPSPSVSKQLPACSSFHLMIFSVYNCKLCNWFVPKSYYLMNHCCNHWFLKFLGQHAEPVLPNMAHTNKAKCSYTKCHILCILYCIQAYFFETSDIRNILQP